MESKVLGVAWWEAKGGLAALTQFGESWAGSSDDLARGEEFLIAGDGLPS